MTISNEARSAMFAENTSDGLLTLLTIDHIELAIPVRVVNNTVDITSRGELFVGFPFELILPESSPNAPPKAQLVIDNVSRELGQIVRSLSSPPTMLIEIVRIENFDSLEMSFPTLKLKNVRFDVIQIRADLEAEDLQGEPYPVHTFSPAHFPGLF